MQDFSQSGRFTASMWTVFRMCCWEQLRSRIHCQATPGQLPCSSRTRQWNSTLTLGQKWPWFPKQSGKTLVSLRCYHRTELWEVQTHVLPAQGKFTGKLVMGTQEAEEEIYVVKGLNKPLLGWPAIAELRLVQRVAAVNDKELSPAEQFPALFEGLGKLQGDYTIQLQEGAKLFALSTPRRVAIPLLKPVKEELQRVEKLGVITKVEEPTEWCAGMVVVLTKNGKVRICVDLTNLNQSVCKERHPLLAVDQTLAQLAVAKVFTKLDANSGFRQIPLFPESALLTTFITPFGHYCFHRLHHVSPWALPTPNVRHSEWSGRCDLQDGWHFGPRQDTGGAWWTAAQGASAATRCRGDTELRGVSLLTDKSLVSWPHHW